MTPTSAKIAELAQASAAQLGENIKRHSQTPQVTFAEHIRRVRKERSELIRDKRLIYLDTNAWKCLADHQLNKPRLTSAMSDFAAAIGRVRESGQFVFPIGLATFFELDALTNPETRDSIVELVDGLSLGYCIAPFPERIGQELTHAGLANFQDDDDPADFLRSPIELLGIPEMVPTDAGLAIVDRNTFNKAFFDTLVQLPFSLQLEVARTSPVSKWDNSRGTEELNQGKVAHQAEIVNLNTGIFVELKGIIEAWKTGEGIPVLSPQVAQQAAAIQYHWHQNPTSRAMPTLRVLSSLYGLMRFDANRKYKDGDQADFLTAASALPIAEAFFTDRRLAALLSEPTLSLNSFSKCVVVSGFEAMTKYIEPTPPTPAAAE